MTRERTQDEKEQIVRAVLSRGSHYTHQAIAKELGVSREYVRQIRIGHVLAKVLPELPREDPQARTQRCTGCRMFEPGQWQCSLGIPESIGPDGMLQNRYAIECSSYLEDPNAAFSEQEIMQRSLARRVADMRREGLNRKQICAMLRISHEKYTFALRQSYA
jgi:DNA-binding CsgD family transcriptional regulator